MNRSYLSFVVFIVVIYVFTYINDINFTWQSTVPLMSITKLEEDISVTYLLTRDTSRVTIYFIETSAVVKARSLCSVESAARHNPQADIILLVTSASLQTDELDLLKRQYRNIQVLRLNAKNLFQDTEFEEFYKSGKLNNSKYLVHHTSDILRTMVIWRFGGIYMDSDVILLKSIINLRNFVVAVAQNNHTIANAEIGFDRNNEVVHKILQRQIYQFNGEKWIHNGPAAVSDVILKLCGTLKPHKCKFVEILPFDAFNALPFSQYEKLFDEKYIDELSQLWNNSYGVHFWNYMWKENEKIFTNVKQPISIIAKQNCPMVFHENIFL
jgi:lactosylceramide 4-alpha-galactosyltransferase